MTIITKGMGAIMKGKKGSSPVSKSRKKIKSPKSWQDKRIAAINKKVKKSGAQPYIEEYGEIISSKAKNKKGFKKEKAKKKAEMKKNYKPLPKPENNE